MLSNFSKKIFELYPLSNSNRNIWLEKYFWIETMVINGAPTVFDVEAMLG